MCNRKSKIIFALLLLLIAGGVIVYICFREQEPNTDFDRLLKDYTRRIERLTEERDSLYRALEAREQQYRHVTDSLNAAILKIQIAQFKKQSTI